MVSRLEWDVGWFVGDDQWASSSGTSGETSSSGTSGGVVEWDVGWFVGDDQWGVVEWDQW